MSTDVADDISPIWLLADQYSIIEAALLIVGVEPQGNAEFVEGRSDQPVGYAAARAAILTGIRTESLRGWVAPTSYEDSRGQISYDDTKPDLAGSHVDRESLVQWLRSRGFTRCFFFPNDPPMAGYLNPEHLRYAPKLAAAVRAWESCELVEKGIGTPKQRMQVWLRKNAARYALFLDDGQHNETAITEIAKVANWQPGGGAPKSEPDPPSEPDDDSFNDEIPF